MVVGEPFVTIFGISTTRTSSAVSLVMGPHLRRLPTQDSGKEVARSYLMMLVAPAMKQWSFSAHIEE